MNLPEKYLNSMKDMLKDDFDFVLTTLRFQQKIFLR